MHPKSKCLPLFTVPYVAMFERAFSLTALFFAKIKILLGVKLIHLVLAI